MLALPDFDPIESVRDGRNIRYLFFSMVSLSVFDHLITFYDEIELVWKKDWSIVKVFFLFARYWNYVLVTFVALGQTHRPISNHTCGVIFIIAVISPYFSNCVIQWLMMLRVNVYTGGRYRAFTWSLNAVCICATTVLTIFTLSKSAGSLVYISFPIDQCIPTRFVPPGLSKGIFIPYLVFESAMFGFMVVRYRTSVKLNGGNSLMQVMLHNGAAYFFGIVLSVLGAIFVTALAPPAFQAVAAPVFTILSTMAICRSVLHLKSQGRSINSSETIELTSNRTIGFNDRPEEIRIDDYRNSDVLSNAKSGFF